jgi:transketolase
MHTVMDENPDVYFLMLGLGYPRVDEFLEKYPDRAFNLEASEQSGLDTAVGLAYAGKIPVVYTITPFLYRAWETIRTYLDHEQLHVILIGVGRDEEYGVHDGFSHSATDIPEIFATMKHMPKFYPDTPDELQGNMQSALTLTGASLINIKR